MAAAVNHICRNPKTAEALRRDESLPSSPGEHVVHFYETDSFLLDVVSGYIGTGLEVGHACIVIATRAHREGLEERLQARGLNLTAARLWGHYRALDAAETLAQFMVDGLPEPRRFAEVVGGQIEQAAQDGRFVRAFGEMVALLWAEGNHAAAVRLEELWNELYHTAAPFSLFCAYPLHDFAGERYEGLFNAICQQHSHVVPDESYSALSSMDECLRAGALLQQQAISLQAEIAERKRAEATVDELKQLEERKNAFISMASHELKTPITSLSGLTQMLQRRLKQQADPQTLLFLDQMASQLKKMTTLINDLLDVSRMQMGTLPFRETSIDFDVLVREAVEQVQATTSYRLVVQGATQARVYGDRDRLGEVFINLLTNAITYSPHANAVLVRLSSTHEQVEVAVQDYGIGIAEEHHERIFERMYRVNGSQENGSQGLGIGLYIARQFVERHGGRLWLESRKGAGSTFRVSLPRQLGENGAHFSAPGFGD